MSVQLLAFRRVQINSRCSLGLSMAVSVSGISDVGCSFIDTMCSRRYVELLDHESFSLLSRRVCSLCMPPRRNFSLGHATTMQRAGGLIVAR